MSTEERITRILNGRRLVAIMGGASKPRTDEFYKRTARTAQLLTNAGCLVIYGGGTGMMEAANFGAYMAPHGPEALQAITTLDACPDYHPLEGAT